MVTEFKTMNCRVDVFDPWLDANIVQDMSDIRLVDELVKGEYDAIVMAVAHDEFKKLSVEEIKAYGLNNHVLYDIKYLLGKSEVDGRL